MYGDSVNLDFAMRYPSGKILHFAHESTDAGNNAGHLVLMPTIPVLLPDLKARTGTIQVSEIMIRYVPKPLE